MLASGDRRRLESRELGHWALRSVEFLLQFAPNEFWWPEGHTEQKETSVTSDDPARGRPCVLGGGGDGPGQDALALHRGRRYDVQRRSSLLRLGEDDSDGSVEANGEEQGLRGSPCWSAFWLDIFSGPKETKLSFAQVAAARGNPADLSEDAGSIDLVERVLEVNRQQTVVLVC